MTQAVVVGSGPNGLAAAVTLAAEGVEVRVLEAAATIGGGTRSGEYTLPGLLHDECSGFHPLAVDSAFSRRIDLSRYGLTWRWPEVQYSHPLDGGRGAAARRSVPETAATLGEDGRAWQRVFGPLASRFGDVTRDFTRPLLHVPEHPIKLGRFGAYAAMPAALMARRFSTEEGRALFGGVAAHAFRPFGGPMSSAVGMALGTSAHTYGWPVAEGGSAAITTAMADLLGDLGGKIETGVRVSSIEELGDPDIVMLDTAPEAAARILGDRMPGRIARAYRRFEHGPGVFQVAFAVEGGIPWTHQDSRLAGTVHVAGSYAEVAQAERDVHAGRMPDRPFVLLGQQYLADPSRSHGDVHPVDAYAHVPTGWTGDATEAIEQQIERFAPGFRDRIVGRHTRSVEQIESSNANYVGGDIITGANTPLRLVFRPRIALDPYLTGVDGVYLCSAATPPGAGAHGMCGFNAAQSALKRLG
ncbi:FAD-dependent oxidoreductase [Aeromicrobium sp. A1-2]|uniref:phytoene desaturase family protein n=1 Tax=Aeromicrobium sp. A1-2 TaxID=2107713 RepID=UPI000E4C7AED|nr:NAD(P)/FAD-dependent oxidoreductase [Aeromicrobium sp. A1-2]AXT83767.1 FAD-dependent oxidoreductase [Aeromicrobium sp. A1-2]